MTKKLCKSISECKIGEQNFSRQTVGDPFAARIRVDGRCIFPVLAVNRCKV